MSLSRRNTRFGLSSVRRATSESDDESNGTGSSGKLRKLPSQDNRGPLDVSPQPWDKASLQQVHVSQEIQSKVGAVDNLSMKNSSPWKSLTKYFFLMLNDSVIIASQKNSRLVTVREFSGLDADRKVKMLQRIWYKNFVKFLDCFNFEESRYVVLEHEISSEEKLAITLRQYALITPYPTEQELATIIG